MLRSETQKDGRTRDRQRPHPPLYQQPHPPPAQPGQNRRGRQRAVRANSLPSGVTPSPQTSRTVSPSSPTPTRPLSRYRVLPSISGDERRASDTTAAVDTALLLALRLPDGRRVQASFSSSDRLDALLQSALAHMDPATGGEGLAAARRRFEVVAAAERKVLSEWAMTLEELGVVDRSVYIIQESE